MRTPSQPVRALLLASLLSATWASTGAFAGEPVWDGNKVHMVREKLAPGVVAY